MRHAKSSWSDPLLEDRERPLNGRGRRAARALGAWMQGAGLKVDEVLCSSSARTRETLQRLGTAGGEVSQHVSYSDALYLAGPDRMLAQLRKARGATVLMLGHNPGIGEMAAAILRAAPPHPRFADYPTGATLVARFGINAWSRADWGGAEAEAFVTPRDLPDPD